MRVVCFLKLLWDSILNKKTVIMLMLIMSSISVYMIDVIGTNYYSKKFTIDSYSSMLREEPQYLNFIKYLDYSDPDYSDEFGRELIEYIRKQDGVKACGRFARSQKNIKEREINILIVEKDIVGIGALGIDEEELRELNTLSGSKAYIGSELKDVISIGQELNYYDDSDSNSYTVSGILKKGASWPKKDRISSGVTNADTYCLDNAIVIITDDYDSFVYMGGMPDIPYYQVNSEGDSELISKNAIKFAADNNIGIKIVNLQEDINNELKNNNLTEDNTFYAGVLLFVLALLSMSAASIVFCMINRQRFGIMIACGISKTQIILINFATNVLTVMIPQICIWLIRQRELFGSIFNVLPKEMEMIMYPYYYGHCVVVPVIFFITLAVVTVCAGIIPAILISRMKVADVIKPVD